MMHERGEKISLQIFMHNVSIKNSNRKKIVNVNRTVKIQE